MQMQDAKKISKFSNVKLCDPLKRSPAQQHMTNTEVYAPLYPGKAGKSSF